LHYPHQEIIFDTLSGELTVTTQADWYILNFPSRKPEPAQLPEIIKNALSKQPHTILKSRDYVLVYETEKEIRELKVDKNRLDQINLDPGGIIVTAKGDHCDFVSRFFTPQASILEDPVTGSAHCSLIPYWSEQLGKKEMYAEQISERHGHLLCMDQHERVLIGGKAKTYSIGCFWLD
jgi:predicted PhzF superfamily epimerase YddE/YHI9